ncbi:uncharacterized protein LAJ45_00545 [Morchella importuna]|uniref:uncharacterized protein n=1 Tax=Morchella importuna TaxID=1174673 RepID=UPI001E8D3E9F|nr:uncharacterized protein LAJ45_00545 [Morchella importuna]KAH8155535.1 hypothetical protein LAJ45_00545 [Morchella importuna]
MHPLQQEDLHCQDETSTGLAAEIFYGQFTAFQLSFLLSAYEFVTIIPVLKSGSRSFHVEYARKLLLRYPPLIILLPKELGEFLRLWCYPRTRVYNEFTVERSLRRRRLALDIFSIFLITHFSHYIHIV